MFSDIPYAGAPFASLGGTSVSVDLTGVTAVGVVGTVDVRTDQIIDVTGVYAVGRVGTIDVS